MIDFAKRDPVLHQQSPKMSQWSFKTFDFVPSSLSSLALSFLHPQTNLHKDILHCRPTTITTTLTTLDPSSFPPSRIQPFFRPFYFAPFTFNLLPLHLLFVSFYLTFYRYLIGCRTFLKSFGINWTAFLASGVESGGVQALLAQSACALFPPSLAKSGGRKRKVCP